MKTKTEIKKIFRIKFKNPNFMTPTIRDYGQIGVNAKLLYEISEGYGLENNRIFGLTFLQLNKDTKEYEQPKTDLSRCFSSMEELKLYIQQLK